MQSYEEVLVAIRQIIRGIDLHSRKLNKSTGLTGPQLVILQELEKGGEHYTIRELSQMVNLSQATVTTILDRLELRKLVYRVRSTQDKRKVHAHLTEAAAEILAALTGSEYFPGGMSGFEITANEFLVFEQGPSVNMTLQWATYRDASDQCSLSRIWGGIHPPADDIPGRLIGEQIGLDAFALASQYFLGNL